MEHGEQLEGLPLTSGRPETQPARRKKMCRQRVRWRHGNYETTAPGEKEKTFAKRAGTRKRRKE